MLNKIIRHRKKLKYCVEALYDLIVCKYLVVYVPFYRYAKKFGFVNCETFFDDLSHRKDEMASILFALRTMPRYLPWQSKCLDQAMAAQRMLKRRKLPSTLYFGVKRNEDHLLIGHAWIRCGDKWIIGHNLKSPYPIVGTYSHW